MPVQWTAVNDRLLLHLILTTHNIKVDSKELIKAWPDAAAGDIPTARAIEERIKKIKKDSSNLMSGKAPSAPSTPVKSTTVTPKTASTVKKASLVKTNSKKRSAFDEDDDMEDAKTPTMREHGKRSASKGVSYAALAAGSGDESQDEDMGSGEPLPDEAATLIRSLAQASARGMGVEMESERHTKKVKVELADEDIIPTSPVSDELAREVYLAREYNVQ